MKKSTNIKGFPSRARDRNLIMTSNDGSVRPKAPDLTEFAREFNGGRKEKLLRQAIKTHQALLRRFKRIDEELKKTHQKQVAKYAMVGARRESLKKLVIQSISRVSRRVNLFGMYPAKILFIQLTQKTGEEFYIETASLFPGELPL